MSMESQLREGVLPLGAQEEAGGGREKAEDQMNLGIKIIQSAFSNKVQTLEQEIRGLRLSSEEQRSNVSQLQKRSSALEVELLESHQQSTQLAEKNKELFQTVNSLRKQIARLEHLKQAVLSSIQDDKDMELGDSRQLTNDDFLKAPMAFPTAEMGLGTGGLGAPPARALPTMTGQYREAAPVPTGSSTPATVDGKAFFRQARSRLSYEAFNLFLASIKRLNNQQQSREETLEEARRIFGPELLDLYRDFEALLNRHGM